jgi:hypothetical protein
MDHLTLQTDELRPYLVRLGRRLRLRDGWLSAHCGSPVWLPRRSNWPAGSGR